MRPSSKRSAGMDGHVDGIQHGDLRVGPVVPATAAGNDLVASIRFEPISIACRQRREGMSHDQMPHHCGFALSLDELSKLGRAESWCSFDQAGQWRVPQDCCARLLRLKAQRTWCISTPSRRQCKRRHSPFKCLQLLRICGSTESIGGLSVVP